MSHVLIEMESVSDCPRTRILLSLPPPCLPFLQVVNVLSISEIKSMIKSIFAVQGANADCQLASFSYFYLVIVPPVNIINLVRSASQHIKEEAGSSVETFVPWLTFLTRQLQRGQDNHCGNEVER